jgi:Mrp family chromosome partitioning ATPase
MSSKGGVGKTSVIVNLAMALLRRGVKCGLMDLNYNSPEIHKIFGFDFEATSEIDKPLIPMTYSDDLKVASIESVMKGRDETGVWGKPLTISDIRRFIFSVNWGELDYLFIDTPAGPGEKLLSVFQAIPDAETIIVTSPNKISGDSAKEMINFFKKNKYQYLAGLKICAGFYVKTAACARSFSAPDPAAEPSFYWASHFWDEYPLIRIWMYARMPGIFFLKSIRNLK